jgi:hypothetical protein
MTEIADGVIASIRGILNLSSPDAIVSGVKGVVSDEIKKLNPEASVTYTDYFNHTYIPDLVMEWSTPNGKEVRPVYLRSSLRPARAADDVRGLAARAPVVLSLAPGVDPQPFERVRREVQSAPRVMVTDIATVANLANDNTPVAAHVADMDRLPSAPLMSLAKANLLRGGRGVIAQPELTRLTTAADLDPAEQLTDERLAEFRAVAREYFSDDASVRLRRASDVLRFGLVPGQDVEPRFEGRLSDSELRVLIPYLLARDEVTRSSEFWGYIGSMMELEDLEELWSTLPGVDITPLVIASLERWRGKRAQLGINSDHDPDEPTDEPYWQLRSKMLSADVGPWRIFIASDGRRLKGRPSGETPSWSELQEPARDFALESVDLKGYSRRVLVSAEASTNVYEDVATIHSSIDDDFKVATLTVLADGDEPVDVDFEGMTATGRRPQTVGMLSRVCFSLLGHRARVDTSAIF